MENKVLTIKDANGQVELDTKIADYHEDGSFIVIDKNEVAEHITETISKQVNKDFDIEEDCHIIYEEIDDYIANDLINSIYYLVETQLREKV